MDHLYRFRSVEGLLGEHAELARQEIYFAPTGELNDPMEGYLDVVWRGDGILWRNLLRNYLVSLVHVAAYGFDEPMDADTQLGLAWLTRVDVKDQPIAPILEEFTSAILAKSPAKRLIAHLADRRRRIGRDELAYWLWTLHPSAVGALLNLMIDRGMLTAAAAPDEKQVARSEAALSGQIDAMRKLAPLTRRRAATYFSVARNTAAQLALIHDYGDPALEQAEAWRFFTRKFPDRYVEGLEAMVYPPWHVACFLEDPRNAAMWGVYGDHHRGVCLKFATQPVESGVGLELEAFSGWQGNSDGIKPHIGKRVLSFQKVRYSPVRPQIEFFSSLGNIPRYKVIGDWLADDQGRRSPLIRDLDAETPAWRTAYWDRFQRSQAVKTPEWAHEREHRLVLSSSGALDKPLRKARYDFGALTGVIFGLRTPDNDKRRIMQVIEQKCREAGRREFEFHQAYWSAANRRLDIAPLPLLKFRFN
ncbi:DUF2971 domain-containing protein [Phenylobacterium soli]|uniref:DUF2971 domain-containing protein n=1 Tax=Phenylobacterium soli TaxID=2170551 RepID=A0A328AK65_9CAUL|nr:DUF2971 domain-containing protein [Phenylobacterium soli]RAK54907.1 hypothetical protein DJ017_10390 [Phenylobacterium soli]